MKVRELIELLQDQDQDAEILVMMQQSYPFECNLAGITTRDDILCEEGDEEEKLEDGCSRSDVFLVEGLQLRYGSKTAWDVLIK